MVKSPPQPDIPVVDDLLALVARGDKEGTRAAMAKALDGLSVQELAAIATKLRDLRGGPLEDEWKITRLAIGVASRWAVHEPSAAMDFMLSRPDSIMDEGNVVFMEGIRKVFAADLPEATRLMAQVRDRETYIYARYYWIDGLKGMDPAEALARIVDFDLHTRNDWHGADAFGEFPALWVNADARAALTWALELPPCQSRSTVLLRMCSASAKNDREAARGFVEATIQSVLPSGNLRFQLLSEIARSKPAAPANE